MTLRSPSDQRKYRVTEKSTDKDYYRLTLKSWVLHKTMATLNESHPCLKVNIQGVEFAVLCFYQYQHMMWWREKEFVRVYGTKSYKKGEHSGREYKSVLTYDLPKTLSTDKLVVLDLYHRWEDAEDDYITHAALAILPWDMFYSYCRERG